MISIFRVTSNDLQAKTNSSAHVSDKESRTVGVIGHKITPVELEKLKQEVGVREQGKNYNPTINGCGTGLRPPTENEWVKIAEQAYMVEDVEWNNPTISSVSYVDHTNSSWFPPIGHQDGEGSCTTWAVGYYMKTFQEAKEHNWNLSAAVWEGGYNGHPTQSYQNKIFSPDFIYHQINDGEDSGSYFSDAIDLVCSIGVCTWEKMPYDPVDSTSWPSEEAWREAPLYRGDSTGIEYMSLETDDGLDNLKNWISSGHLAAIAVDAYQYSHLTSGDLWTIDNYLNPDVNHANTIVGYNDDLGYIEQGMTRYGAFKVANSWGVGGWENINDGCYWISYEAMKHRVGYCVFYHDRIDYEPTMVTSFTIDHSKRGECNISVGIGNESTPLWTKRFDDWILKGGDHPFCFNHIVLDITEFEDAVSTVINQSFFMKAYDGGSFTTGTITSFSIEYYHDYSSGTLCAKSTSLDVPVDTINNADVFANLILNATWIVDDDGPADFHTIQEALNAAHNGDTIYVKNGTYYENLAVSEALSLIGQDKETTIIDGNYGEDVIAVSANGVKITGFTIQNCNHSAIKTCDGSHGNNISYNVIRNSHRGIFLPISSNNSVHRNDIINCLFSIEFYSCSNNSIVENNIYYSPGGITVGSGGNNNSIINNKFTESGLGFWKAYGNVVENNTVNGKPLIYLEDVSEYTVDHAGQAILVNCDNILIENLNLSNTPVGLELFQTNNCIVRNNNMTNNEYGIRLVEAHNNTISGNDITNNSDGVCLICSSNNTLSCNNVINNIGSGIGLNESSNYNSVFGNHLATNRRGIEVNNSSNSNVISGNNITNNVHGIELCVSYNNIFSGNSITVNSYGVYLNESSDNNFCHNNFIHNTQQVYIHTSGYANFWDGGYPSGGNYWSDYNGTDLYSGGHQNETGSDVIGDTPYTIDENNQDNYPLTGPWTLEGENVTITPSTTVAVTFVNVTSGGITTFNATQGGPDPPSRVKFITEPPIYYDIKTTANYTGTIKISIAYNDTGLTEDQENNLQILQWNEALQQWTDITTHVDTENNIIHGETTHLSIFAIMSPPNIAVTNIKISKPVVGQEYPVTINVTVENQGYFTESFNVTVFYDEIAITLPDGKNHKTIAIPSGNSSIATFPWNTTGVPYGNHAISANATPVLGETDTTDNTLTDGTVLVTFPGDVNGDGKVRIDDILVVALAFGMDLGDPDYDPNVDINCDDKIRVDDILIAAQNFGLG